MPVLTSLPPRAGIFTYESTAGATPPILTLYQRTYVLGGATLGTAEPTAIGSMDDFVNLFGSSTAIALDSIEAYLLNTRQGLFYSRVSPAPITTVTIATGAGAKTITLAGTAITYTASAGDTAQVIIDALVSAINNNTSINIAIEAEHERDGAGVNLYTNSRFVVRSKAGATFTAVGGTGVTPTAVAAPTTPRYWDYIRSINRLKTDYATEPLGFLVCPEAFFTLTSQFERTQVANTLEAAARDLGWLAPIDPGSPTAIASPAAAVIEANTFTAIRGHSASYYPYLKNMDGDFVSPAMMQAAIGLMRYERDGIHQPPAGGRYPLNGIGGLAYTMTTAELDLLATNKVNPFLFKRGVGYVLFDSVTRSADPNFKFINTRVILSCLERSIQDTVDASGSLFQAIGGRGLFFIQLRATIEGVVARYYEADALYGVLPNLAYAIRCDAAMQQAADLEAGIVVAEIYAVPAITVRQIRQTVYRVKIGGLQQALTLAGVV